METQWTVTYYDNGDYKTYAKHQSDSWSSHLVETLTKLGRERVERHRESDDGLTPQLIGLEGKRVEVVTTYGETRRFYVGNSTGWMPCHLEISRINSSGGPAADKTYTSVRVVGTKRRY